MGFFTTKITLGLIAGATALSAVAYTGAQHADDIQKALDDLKYRVQVTSDEAYTKIREANVKIADKNDEITQLQDTVEGLQTELNEANANVTAANTDLAETKAKADSTTSAVDKDMVTTNLVDTMSEDERALEITIVRDMDTETTETVRIFNKNKTPIYVSYRGLNTTIAGGDAFYDERAKGSTTVYIYTLQGKEVRNTK